MKDEELIKRLASIFSRYLHDQSQAAPLHDYDKVIMEIDGELADLQFHDKAENQMLIRFLSVYLGVRERKEEETITILGDAASAFSKLSKSS